MGEYTEIIIKAEVKADLPQEVEAVLQFLFNGEEKPLVSIDHPFFKCDRWAFIGRCSSYYHIPWSTSKYEEEYIFSRSDLKDYDNEIDQFFAWIDPYLDEEQGQCVGWSWYEEESAPTLQFKRS